MTRPKVNSLIEKDISLLAERKGDAVKLVVRHAERPFLKGLRPHHEVNITENGRQASFRLGGLLKDYGLMIGRTSSSPVPRCVQTAELIASGNQYNGVVEISPVLGDPGPFMENSEALNATLDTCTIEDVISRQLSGDKVPGMRDIESGLRIFMGHVMSDPSNSFEVFVSHDVFVCPAVHYLTRTAYSEEGNVGFLDGFFICSDGREVGLLWNSRWYDVTGRLGPLLTERT